MKKLLALLLVLALCLSMTACATKNGTEETTETPTTEAASDPSGTNESEADGSTPLLYKVTGENGSVVWLFGSVHVGIEEMYPLPDYVLDAYNEADALAVECDVIAAQEDMGRMMELMQNMIYLDGTTIADHISPELYDAAVAILKENHTYMSALDYYYPVMWYSFIDSFMYANYGYDAEAGIDMTLLNMAKDEGKPILEVESVEFQYNMLASFSPELQEVLLQDAVDSYGTEDAKVMLDGLLYAWCAGDEAAIAEYLSAESDEPMDPELEALLAEFTTAMETDRNIAMADYAEEILRSGGKVFICVGMAHILGDGAMVDLLEQRGYTVEAVHG